MQLYIYNLLLYTIYTSEAIRILDLSKYKFGFHLVGVILCFCMLIMLNHSAYSDSDVRVYEGNLLNIFWFSYISSFKM